MIGEQTERALWSAFPRAARARRLDGLHNHPASLSRLCEQGEVHAVCAKGVAQGKYLHEQS